MSELELRRVLPAPPTVVWAALTDPAELAQWWGPEGFNLPDATFAAAIGESYRFTMQPPEGAPFALAGVVLEADPPARLAYTFNWEPPDPDDVETEVRLALRAIGGSTELALAQGPFATDARLALHRDGWSQSLDRLARRLSRGGRSRATS